MRQSQFSVTVEIPASPSLVWPVMTAVERWPTWTASIARVKMLSAGPLAAGSRVRIHQPKFPPAWWRVTDFQPERSFTWVSTAPGLRVTARHAVEPAASGSRVTLSIGYEGLFGPWFARWTRNTIERYLALEADGLKTHCAALAKTQIPKPHETR